MFSAGARASRADVGKSCRGGGRKAILSPDVLTAAQVRAWRTKGWVVVDGLWPEATIAAAATAAEQVYPLPQPADGQPLPSAQPHANAFPFSRQALNDLVLHPRVLRAAAQLLGDDDVRFYGDVMLGKYGEEPLTGDQDLHLDFVRPQHCLQLSATN